MEHWIDTRENGSPCMSDSPELSKTRAHAMIDMIAFRIF